MKIYYLGYFCGNFLADLWIKNNLNYAFGHSVIATILFVIFFSTFIFIKEKFFNEI
jgi:hypothetical protein